MVANGDVIAFAAHVVVVVVVDVEDEDEEGAIKRWDLRSPPMTLWRLSAPIGRVATR